MDMPSTFSVETADGWTLEVEEHVPASHREAVGHALLTHAMMVDRRTYTRGGRGLAYFLAERGWRVFVADFRGRRHTGRVPEKGAQWTYDDLVQFDLPALVSGVRARTGEEGLVYIGHSWEDIRASRQQVPGSFRPLQMPTSAFRPISGAPVWSPTPIFD